MRKKRGRKRQGRRSGSRKLKHRSAKLKGARKRKLIRRKKHAAYRRKLNPVPQAIPVNEAVPAPAAAEHAEIGEAAAVQEAPTGAPLELEKGINLIGYVRSETGLGESCRLAAQSLETTALPFGMLHFPLNFIRSEDFTWSHKEMEHARYAVNVFHMNADMIGHAMNHFGPSLLNGRFNIGYWHWELPEFPEEYCGAFQSLQEIWVPSKFVADSISSKAKIPVVRIPHGIRVQLDSGMDRSSFALPEHSYLFMCMYDTQSYQARKNPQGALQAFKLAFAPHDSNVGLVVKVNNAGLKGQELQALREQIAGYPNMYILDSQLSRIQVNSLLHCTDCLISLHRSEGFGLGLAEAMYLGKPVIATGWSGNADFMHASNSCPVNYELVRVAQDYGPYKANQLWAEPDLSHAAALMRQVVETPSWRKQIAAAGQKTIREFYSPELAGTKMIERLQRLNVL